VYGSYWNRIEEHWATGISTKRHLRTQLVEHVNANVVPRRNARGGRSAGEHLVAALRCLYGHAEDDGLIDPADNPASKVAKPRRPLRAVADTRLGEINNTAATTGNDPALDSSFFTCQWNRRPVSSILMM
jgi:integrase/recombinase XerC